MGTALDSVTTRQTESHPHQRLSPPAVAAGVSQSASGSRFVWTTSCTSNLTDAKLNLQPLPAHPAPKLRGHLCSVSWFVVYARDLESLLMPPSFLLTHRVSAQINFPLAFPPLIPGQAEWIPLFSALRYLSHPSLICNKLCGSLPAFISRSFIFMKYSTCDTEFLNTRTISLSS